MMKRSEPASPAVNTTSPPLTAFEYASFESGVGISGILPCLTGPGAMAAGPGGNASEGQREAGDHADLRHEAVARDREQDVDAEQQRPGDVGAHPDPRH